MRGTVGVITRTKNRPVLLKRALESVLSQSYQDWTLVIVNDGGEPAAVERIVAYYGPRAQGRVTVIHSERSQGMEVASNLGIRAVECDYLVIHDDDDSWSPEFLTIAVTELDRAHALHPRIMGISTMANVVFERIDGNVVTIERVEESKPWVNKGLISLDAMLCETQFAPIQFLYRSDSLAKTGLYREDLPVLGDWEFNIRFLLQYDIMVVPQVLALFHVREQDFDSNYGNSIFTQRDQHELFRQLIKNEWLRNDVDSGSASLGQLTHVRPHMNHFHWNVDQIHRKLDEINQHFRLQMEHSQQCMDRIIFKLDEINRNHMGQMENTQHWMQQITWRLDNLSTKADAVEDASKILASRFQKRNWWHNGEYKDIPTFSSLPDRISKWKLLTKCFRYGKQFVRSLIQNGLGQTWHKTLTTVKPWFKNQ